MRAGSLVFGRTPGARPAIVAGLVNGVAIGTPLLVGVVAGEPAAGATACLGAYVAAFTNKGGGRRRRTTGLVVTASINTVAFAAGAATTQLFPLDVAIFAALVFIASMGAAFGATAARCGTMPATAFLTGVFASQDSLAAAVGLVAAGGLWYTAATFALTPTPRLRSLLATIGTAYREVALLMAEETTDFPPHRPALTVALRNADEAVLVLAGPGGDDVTAQATRTLVDAAAQLVDSIAGLRFAGEPDAAIVAEYRALVESVRLRLEAIADGLSGGKPWRPLPADPTLERFVDACTRLRQAAVVGEVDYARMSATAHLKRRIVGISAAVDLVSSRVTELIGAPNLRLPETDSRATHVTAAGLRGAMRLSSTTYRHALRATAITSALLAVVTLAHLDHGEWAALAALRVLRPQYGATTQRAWQRVVGNVIGGTSVAVAIAWIHSPAVLAALVFVIITVGFALRPVNYAFWVLFGTPLILLIGDLADPGDWHAAVGRIVMTIVGTATAVIGYFLLLPDWDVGRLPGRLAQARTHTADYLDVVLAHVAEPTSERRAVLDAARRTATSAVHDVTETLEHASREPVHAGLNGTATVVNRLAIIVERSAALTALPDARSSPIPHVTEYRDHAVSAIRGSGDAADVTALDTAVDGMRRYVGELHQQREVEMRAQPDGDTPLRAAVRENEPVIEELARIADAIVSLGLTAGGSPGIRQPAQANPMRSRSAAEGRRRPFSGRPPSGSSR